MGSIESIHYVGCASPAALLFQNGMLDAKVPPANAWRYQEAVSEPRTIRWYCTSHALNAVALRDQAEFLSEWIRISPFAVDAQVLAAYAGRYQHADFIATIRVDGNHIFIQFPDELIPGENELFAGSEDRFYMEATYFEFTFYRNENGVVDRMEIVASGETYEAKKLP